MRRRNAIIETNDFRPTGIRATDLSVTVSVSIIEDDPSIRQILAGWISNAEEFRCASTHDSAESALAKLPQENPQIVLVDINLPGQSGIECVRRLKPVFPQTQVIMLTVYQNTEHIFNALAAGATTVTHGAVAASTALS